MPLLTCIDQSSLTLAKNNDADDTISIIETETDESARQGFIWQVADNLSPRRVPAESHVHPHGSAFAFYSALPNEETAPDTGAHAAAFDVLQAVVEGVRQ